MRYREPTEFARFRSRFNGFFTEPHDEVDRICSHRHTTMHAATACARQLLLRNIHITGLWTMATVFVEGCEDERPTKESLWYPLHIPTTAKRRPAKKAGDSQPAKRATQPKSPKSTPRSTARKVAPVRFSDTEPTGDVDE